MPPITRLGGIDPLNLLVIGRPGLPDVSYLLAAYTVWRAANPTASAADAEAQIQTALAVLWPSAPVQIQVHVFDLMTPRIGVLVANPGEPIPAQWWVLP